MGRGISGIIPITFSIAKGYYTSDYEQNRDDLIKRSSPNFFDCFNREEDDQYKELFSIKSELLLPNLKEFMIEFHALIEYKDVFDSMAKFNDEKYDKILANKDIDAFLEYFSANDGTMPYYTGVYIGFSATKPIDCHRYLIFYMGSYKALLEEYSTLRHLEVILGKTLRNPLAQLLQIGIYG
ncbi:MAG: hypothetical protein LBR10_03235 [Prevotellaceae bacterium]|jgi:hypothetical protein|nr:hypothetical protein [Prevotellaceae bacterium]